MLTFSRVLCLGAILAQSREESDECISLLQFQVNLSASENLSLNSTVKIPRARLKENLTAGAENVAPMYLQRSYVKPRTGRHISLVWISSVLLLFAFLSLLRHLVPLLINYSARRAQSHENDAPETGSPSVTKQTTPVLFYGTLYIICSCALIKYNKYLMSDGRFPYSVNLTLGHQASGSVFLYFLYKMRPSLYPSLSGTGENRVRCFTFFRGLLPVAICFSGQLVLSNTAYIYTSVAFLQMMKEGNMVLVYLGSLLVGLEAFHSVRARVLLCLLLSTALTIQGQITFSLTGFAVQGISQFMEATKIVLQSVLLSAAGSGHLDPYSYNLVVQPTTACLIFSFLCFANVYIPAVPLAPWAAYVAWLPHLIANCMIALALNLVIAFFIAHSSAVGFIIAGIAKDICLIIADIVFSGTQVSKLQYIAFGLQVSFVTAYSLLKLYSKQLEPGEVKVVTKEKQLEPNEVKVVTK